MTQVFSPGDIGLQIASEERRIAEALESLTNESTGPGSQSDDGEIKVDPHVVDILVIRVSKFGYTVGNVIEKAGLLQTYDEEDHPKVIEAYRVATEDKLAKMENKVT